MAETNATSKVIQYVYNATDEAWDVSISDKTLDAATNAVNTIDYTHHETHSGSHYFVSGFTVLFSAAVDSGNYSIDWGVVR